jgi:hypothetical protein
VVLIPQESDLKTYGFFDFVNHNSKITIVTGNTIDVNNLEISVEIILSIFKDKNERKEIIGIPSPDPEEQLTFSLVNQRKSLKLKKRLCDYREINKLLSSSSSVTFKKIKSKELNQLNRDFLNKLIEDVESGCKVSKSELSKLVSSIMEAFSVEEVDILDYSTRIMGVSKTSKF